MGKHCNAQPAIILCYNTINTDLVYLSSNCNWHTLHLKHMMMARLTGTKLNDWTLTSYQLTTLK